MHEEGSNKGQKSPLLKPEAHTQNIGTFKAVIARQNK